MSEQEHIESEMTRLPPKAQRQLDAVKDNLCKICGLRLGEQKYFTWSAIDGGTHSACEPPLSDAEVADLEVLLRDALDRGISRTVSHSKIEALQKLLRAVTEPLDEDDAPSAAV